MKKLLVSAFVFLSFCMPVVTSAYSYYDGYFESNGTYTRPSYRSYSSDIYDYGNWSYSLPTSWNMNKTTRYGGYSKPSSYGEYNQNPYYYSDSYYSY